MSTMGGKKETLYFVVLYSLSVYIAFSTQSCILKTVTWNASITYVCFQKTQNCESHLPIQKSLYFLAHNVLFIYFFIYTCFFIYCVNVTVLTQGNVQFRSPFVCTIFGGKWDKNKVY